jgi:hypothetical protein
MEESASRFAKASFDFAQDERVIDSDSESVLKKMPTELQVYMTQFLGDSAAEILKNIMRLSMVDKHFNALITQHKKSSGILIRDRLDENKIVEEFRNILHSGNLKLIKLFDEFGLIDQETQKEFIMAVLLELLDLIRYFPSQIENLDRIKEFFKSGIITAYQPSLSQEGDTTTPLDAIGFAYKSATSTQEENALKDLMIFLIKEGFVNIHDEDALGRNQLIVRAKNKQNFKLAEFLVKQVNPNYQPQREEIQLILSHDLFN